MYTVPNIVTISRAKPEHYNLISATWTNGFFHGGSKFCENLSWEVYKEFHPRLIASVLSRATVLVASPKEEPEVCIAYFVYEPEVAHFLYVKYLFRNYGVARELWKASGLSDRASYTHRTKEMGWVQGHWKLVDKGLDKVKVFIPGKMPTLIYNPYQI